MTWEEAVKKAKDGFKIRCVLWKPESHVFWDGRHFVRMNRAPKPLTNQGKKADGTPRYRKGSNAGQVYLGPSFDAARAEWEVWAGETA